MRFFYVHLGASEKNRGFSLVELMVALVVGLLVTLGAFQLIVTSKKTFNHSLAVLERQESLRFLIDSISYDIRSSRFINLIDADGNVLSDFKTLSMTLERDNSICSGSDIYSLSYYQQDGSIRVATTCAGTVGVDESIVLGVGDITFSYISPSFGVAVNIVMEDAQGRLPPESFNFVVANRSAVGEVLELWGVGI